MSGNARALDIWVGICCCHEDPTCIPMIGPIMSWSNDTKINGLGQARHLDTVLGNCGHAGVIIASSTDSKVNGRGMARQLDDVTGCTIGKIMGCSSDVKTN